jgi:hypothetical protein
VRETPTDVWENLWFQLQCFLFFNELLNLLNRKEMHGITFLLVAQEKERERDACCLFALVFRLWMN